MPVRGDTAEGPDNGVIETDALVVGAGPVGLFQVFQLGLLEIKAHVVDALAYAGGQCMELYPDKPIYDIPAIPVCTGRQLTASLLQQVAPFDPVFHFGQVVQTVQRQDDGRFRVHTSKGTRFSARTVFIAGGVGAFQPKLLKVEGLDKYRDTQLHYQVADQADFSGQRVVIVGGDDVALEWAIRLAEPHGAQGVTRARSVTLVHRRDVLQAAPDTVARMRALCASGAIAFRVGQVSGIEEADGRLTGVQITGVEDDAQVEPLDTLLVFFGLSPKLGPIADWGLAMERKQLPVNTETFGTSEAGIFAVGDINTYPGKKKLILCGFHECVLAAYGAAPCVFPDRKIQLQYTTTSTRLHALLGVATSTHD